MIKGRHSICGVSPTEVEMLLVNIYIGMDF